MSQGSIGDQAAPEDMVQELIETITKRKNDDLYEAKCLSRKISWSARFVIFLGLLSFLLSMVATPLKVPSYFVTITLTLAGALEWLRQNRGWREKAAAFWASHDFCEQLVRELRFQNAVVSNDRLAKFDRDFTAHLRDRGGRLSKAGQEADKKNLASIFSAVKQDTKS